jgi:aryl-alcohol dehydrogenase-like predicted oxidoreductase
MAPRFAPRRPLGRTGFVATALGLGDLADRAAGVDSCVAALRHGLDAGVNLVDTAPSYEDGFSEEVVGKALAGRRSGVFVIDKIDHFDRPVADQVAGSVSRLGFSPDAFVFHGVSDMNTYRNLPLHDLANHVRFRGVSSHHPHVVRAAIEDDRCDLVMFAVGPFVDARYLELVKLAREKGVATVCFKTFGAGKLLSDTEGYGKPATPIGSPVLTVEECVHYSMTIDPDVALLGLSNESEMDVAFAAAERFVPMSEEAMEATRHRAKASVVGKGKIWWDPAEDRAI